MLPKQFIEGGKSYFFYFVSRDLKCFGMKREMSVLFLVTRDPLNSREP